MSRVDLALEQLPRKFESSSKNRSIEEKKSVNVNTQTNITNLDFKELKQPLALIKQRSEMKTELQDVKDRIFQLQCDSKLKGRIVSN